MPSPKKGKRLGAGPSHQKAMLASLATSLFEHGQITTTEAKARTLRPYAEKLITKAKKGDLHNRRQVMRVIRDTDVVHELFTEIGPRYAERPGGYTRITKLGPRHGDNAPMAVIALVEEEFTPQARSTRSSAAPAAAASVATADGGAGDTGADEAAADGDVAGGAAVDGDVTDGAAEDAGADGAATAGEADAEAGESGADAAEADQDAASGAASDAVSGQDAAEADKDA